MIRGIARKFFEGKKCLFCGKYNLYRLKDKRVKCKNCNKYYSIKKLKRNLELLYYFYLEISARRAAIELDLNYKSVHKKFMDFRRRLDNIIDGMRKNLNFVLKNKPKRNAVSPDFYQGVLYAYRNIKEITKELDNK